MREESSSWKKIASRSKHLSLEHAIKFVTASDDEEFSGIESSESESDSDESNRDYLDVSKENLGGNVKSFLEVEKIEVKRSNLCWVSILFYFLRFRSLIFYIICIIDVIYGYKPWNFMNSNCCLQKHWRKRPWKIILSIFCDDVIMT